MDFSTKIKIIGRNGESDPVDKIRAPLAREIQKTGNRDTNYMRDVKSFVTAVVARAGSGKIRRLQIADHGNEDGCFFGKDWITTANFEKFAPYLGRISTYLTKDASVYLAHSKMGQNPGLMKLFAFCFGVKVYAGTGTETAAPFSFNTGAYVGCTPAGTIFKETRRPLKRSLDGKF
jgi:hypothetical protein